MARPRLSLALTWERFEQSVLVVFREALRRLAALERLPAAEEPISLELYWIALRVHQEQLNSEGGSIPFVIDLDSTNKPEPDDSARSPRMKKRPDFACVIKDQQASDFRRSQITYYLECKRLGTQEEDRVYNDLYSEKGVMRFIAAEHQYGKGCTSAVMIGYLQNMEPDEVLREVNKFAKNRSLPSLTRAAAEWAKRQETALSQPPLTRAFDSTAIRLGHFWVDLRHCRFDLPSDRPPQSAEASAAQSPAPVASPAKSTPAKKSSRKKRHSA